MSDDTAFLPDARAVALVEMACGLARTEADLTAFGTVNADALKALNPPTYRACREVYARRLKALRSPK